MYNRNLTDPNLGQIPKFLTHLKGSKKQLFSAIFGRCRLELKSYIIQFNLIWCVCVYVQRWDLFLANLVKQDPGRARQNS